MDVLRCYRDLARAKRTAGVSELLDFVFASCIAPLQVRSELGRLAEIVAGLRPERAMEIGTSSGGTLFLLCRLAAPTATILSLDLPGGPGGGGYHWLKIPLYKRFAGHRQRLHLLRGDSHDGAMLVKARGKLDGAPLDYLFIDGDHSYPGVKQDFEMYAPLVRKGGVVAFHDINPGQRDQSGQVPKYWAEVRSGYNSEEIIANPNQGYGIGVLRL